MAAQDVDEIAQSPAYHSLSGEEPDDAEDDNDSQPLEPPIHPLPSMQAAFEESIRESRDEEDAQSSPEPGDAQLRRQRLLELKQYDDSWTARWKQRQAAQHHPLTKLMAQIVFGMHLLQQQQAMSEEEVVKILQTHVNEVDTFLERTAEDFDLAIKDIEDRMRYLKLPMTHREVFETMLEDKKFRTQLLDGNEKIVRIIERTAKAMGATLLDIQKGIGANRELGVYMDAIQNEWPKEDAGISEIFEAMRGNEQGWKKYLVDLENKADNLGQTLSQLKAVIAEMSKMAAEASRRHKAHKAALDGSKSAPASPRLESKFSQATAPAVPSPPRDLNKPLPVGPPVRPETTRSISSMSQPASNPQKYEVPRPTPAPPKRKVIPRAPAAAFETPARPRTAGGPASKQARAANERSDTADLASFFQKDSIEAKPSIEARTSAEAKANSLRSAPPENNFRFMRYAQAAEAVFGAHAQRQNTDSSLTALPSVRKDSISSMPRSSSQGHMEILTGAHGRVAGLERSQPGSLQQQVNIQQSGVGQSSTPQMTRPRNGSGQASMQPSGALQNGAQQSPVEPSVKSSSTIVDKKEVMQGTGFARRLSKRMKHLPAGQEEAAAGNPATENPPPDSAYASGQDSSNLSPPNTRTHKPERPTSTLGPLPFSPTRTTYQQAPTDRQQYPQEEYEIGPAYHPSSAPSVRSLASTSKSGGSWKKLLRMRFKVSEKMLAS